MVDVLTGLIPSPKPELKGRRDAEPTSDPAPAREPQRRDTQSPEDGKSSTSSEPENFDKVFSGHAKEPAESETTTDTSAGPAKRAGSRHPHSVLEFVKDTISPAQVTNVDANATNKTDWPSVFPETAPIQPPLKGEKLVGASGTSKLALNAVGDLRPGGMSFPPQQAGGVTLASVNKLAATQTQGGSLSLATMSASFFSGGDELAPSDEKLLLPSKVSVASTKQMTAGANVSNAQIATPDIAVFKPAQFHNSGAVFGLEHGLVEVALNRVSADAPVQSNSASLQHISSSSPVIAQIASAIRADRTATTIDVRLDPPDLGRVRIEFTMETADAVKAVLSAERSETLDHMRRNTAQLLNELKQAGFASVDIEFSNQKDKSLSDRPSEVAGEGIGFAGADSAGSEIVYLSMRNSTKLNLLV